MDKWTAIILDAEKMWAASADMRTAQDCGTKEYVRRRDIFKAERIYDLYGYENFLKFIKGCPHIQKEMARKYLPCDCDNGQCNMFCIFYEGGCTYATK